MKLAMRLPAKGQRSADADPDTDPDTDPREEAGGEVIDLASRTAYPVVANRKGGRSDGLALAGGIGFVALLGAATLWGLNASRMGSDEAAQPAAPAAPAPPQAGIAPPTPEQQAAIAAATPVAPADPAPSPVYAVPPHVAAMPVANPYASPTVVYDSSALPAPAAAVAAPGEQAAANTSSPVAGSAGDFASRLGGVGGGAATASSNFDPATTITQGTMIPAVLETAINTDVPGYVRAVVSQDVKSYDGRRILVPRSSRLIGQYQSGLQQGQKRAYVIWTRLIRPDGVSVALASPGTAFDGSGGLPGKVDTHFFQRFGSAMLLSVIGGLTAVASGGGSLILNGGQSAAGEAMQQGGQIGPTIRVPMGEPIRVFTARDLDFSQGAQVVGAPLTAEIHQLQGDEPEDLPLAPSGSVYLDAYLAPFQHWLERDTVTEIIVNRPGEVWIEDAGEGRMSRVKAPEIDDKLVQRLAEQVARVSHQGINREHPLLGATLPDGARIQFCGPPATRRHWAMAIRRHRRLDLPLDAYDAGPLQAKREPDLPDPAAEPIAFLRAAIQARKTILISGGTSTGKTTFLNAMLGEIPAHERVVLVEDTPELKLPGANGVGLVAVKGELGEAKVTANELLQSALRLRPDRIVLGELRGAESVSFLRAINTGHPGSFSTIHANSTRGALEQLALMVMQTGIGLTRSDTIAYAASVIDIIVQLERTNGTRQITAIARSGDLV